MTKKIIRRFDDGLILRTATPGDAQALSDFNARIHSDLGPDQPDEGVRAWTRDLLERPHPSFQPGDFTIVEDPATGQIVSSLNLIAQTWSYGGIQFEVGRPELVGTAPEYRQRGLVRAQFEVIHQWSAQRGQQVLGITGIPYYYRLFGYEMAMDLGGGRIGFAGFIPKLKDGEVEPYLIRPALEGDLAFIADLYDKVQSRYLVHCVRDQALWRYELSGKSSKNVDRSELRMIETAAGEAVGYLIHPGRLWGPRLAANQFELKPGVSWGQVTPSVARYLFDTAKILANQAENPIDVDGFAFWLGREHPVYQVLHDSLPRVRQPYAWYLRVPDLVGFLRLVSPVLEKNLAASSYQGHTREIKLTFYTQGILLSIENGLLAKIEPYSPSPVGHAGDAAFPGLTFLQLLFGYRSLEELCFAFADCWYETDEIFGLLNALFPKRPCNLWFVS